MNQKNITIAEFIGVKFKPYNIDRPPFYSSSIDKEFNSIRECRNWIDLNKISELYHPMPVGLVLKFDTSWDWLMPVLSRIKETRNENTNVYSEQNECLYSNIFNSLKNIDISETYNHCINYITWYNEYYIDSNDECNTG